MTILTEATSALLWRNLIKEAENSCDITLQTDLEAYLVFLLKRYIAQPEVLNSLIATTFLQALQSQAMVRAQALQQVGDQCLLYAGLFPQLAHKRHVRISYFVQLGQAAYQTASAETNDLYWLLSDQFVTLMDVLQAIRPTKLTPLEAYEQWESVGSKRALKTLDDYTDGKLFPSSFRLS